MKSLFKDGFLLGFPSFRTLFEVGRITVFINLFAMKSPRHSTMPKTNPMKLLPASAATTMQWKQKIAGSNIDEGLQAKDTRRRYMRRGSKTPTMLLIEASRDLDLLGKSLFPTLDGQYSNITNISYHTLTSKALAMASAIDALPDSYLPHCCALATSHESSRMLNSSPDEYTNHDVIPSNGEEEEFRRNVQTASHCVQPRRLSVMTALKLHLENASISKTPALTIPQIKDDHR